jgi:hypothetical protein
MTAPAPAATLSRDQAAVYLTGQLRLRRPLKRKGAGGVRALLETLRAIQLDPLDPMGTNADLVALARVDGIARGDVYRHLLPGHAFEHFAKERCLLPAYAFPYYRDQAVETPWWRLTERLRRLPERVVTEVLAEVRERGPLGPRECTSRGRVEALDWNGWTGTARAATMALEVLWTRCQIVVAGRRPRGKLYDVPERALPEHADAAGGDFERFALLERVEAAGLLAEAAGPHWSMLRDTRRGPLPSTLVDEGLLERVRIEGSPRTYLAPAGFRRRRFPSHDDRMRILGPLDPLLWDRALVRHAFGFDYVWEVYKPAAKRKWGYYVCPLLHRGELVGRLEGAAKGGSLVVERLYREPDRAFDEDALDAALQRHADACGLSKVVRRSRARRRRPKRAR